MELPLPRSRQELLLGVCIAVLLLVSLISVAHDAGIPKFQAFLLLIFYGSSSQVSRGVAACLQQGKEALLQIESASMPLDVHKNCLRICIARCRRVERLLEMSFFDSAAGVEAKRRRKSRPILSVSLQPKNPRPILSGRKHHSIQNYLRCKGLSWPCAFNVTRENYPGESFHHR